MWRDCLLGSGETGPSILGNAFVYNACAAERRADRLSHGAAPHLSHGERRDESGYTEPTLSQRVRPGASVALPHPITLSRAALYPLNREVDDTGRGYSPPRREGTIDAALRNSPGSSRCFLILTGATGGEEGKRDGQRGLFPRHSGGRMLAGKQQSTQVR
ncbi:hypothetical protein L3Q82_013441 [Scortum barcoo]|uniref:Uncharacterized protein n=1 Tax=Scortum barcoo TaxID=214431 RepID=A0ACB8W0J3_9TELE|nr:hypothetical protein L3Q82_013441 [Scortum barcoo]